MHHNPYDTEREGFDNLLIVDDLHAAERIKHRKRQVRASIDGHRKRTRLTRPPRREADQAFKCRHCRQFIGVPICGGRHRNHCPNCLFSLHVDDKRPGDRRSDCHALMQPVGLLARRNGEQVIIHLCLGCGKEHPNRVGADDNPVLLMRLQPIRSGGLMLVVTDNNAAMEEETA